MDVAVAVKTSGPDALVPPCLLGWDLRMVAKSKGYDIHNMVVGGGEGERRKKTIKCEMSVQGIILQCNMTLLGGDDSC